MSVLDIYHQETTKDPEKRHFTYNTLHAPLFFHAPTDDECEVFAAAINSIHRRYIHLLTRNKIEHDDFLLHSSGIALTGGEIAIHMIQHRNK